MAADSQRPDSNYTESILVNRFSVEGDLFDMSFRGSLLTRASETLTDCESRLITPIAQLLHSVCGISPAST